jgi:hypothetical protein
MDRREQVRREFPMQGPDNYFGDCVVCGCDESEFNVGIALGELTLSDVNSERMNVSLGPICSRSCLLELGDGVFPHRELDPLEIAERFRYSPAER